MAVGTFCLATDTALPAVFPVSVAALAWPRVTVPRASPPRRPAVRSPLHFVCVLLARPMFRETRLPGPFFLVHPIVSRTPADCGPACWARTHRATAHATLLLRECSSRCCGSRPSPHPLVSAYSAPPACYHGSRLSGDLHRVTLHLAGPGHEVSNKEVSRRAVARTGRWGVWAPSVLASRCPCEVM